MTASRPARWMLVGALLLSPACGATQAGAPDRVDCPGALEQPEDCPWASLGRRLGREAAAGGDTVAALRAVAPAIDAALGEDANYPQVLALWGRSQNLDELAKAEIIPPTLLDALDARAGVEPREGTRTHAGVEHTYGYLLSTLRTPFGWKRARWVKPELALGFSLPNDALGPTPAKGTLLTNVTYFAGRIAFRSDRRARATLEQVKSVVEPTIARLAYDQLAITRLTETLVVSGRTVLLRTDFVPFPRAVTGAASTHLLVYSIADSSASGPRLVTAFPVTTAFVQKALDPAELGDALPITTRYNAFVDGVTGQDPPLRGRRGADGPAPP